MNAQVAHAASIADNALTSDNLQDIVLTIRSKIFSVEAKRIEETVEGTSAINSEYKEYDIGGKLHESYTGPYEVTQKAVKTKIGSSMFASDKYVAKGNYHYQRKGNTIKFVSLGSMNLCIGTNSAHRIGILVTTAIFKNTMVLGATAKLTVLGVSLYMSNRVHSMGVHGFLVGVYKEKCIRRTYIVQHLLSVNVLKGSNVLNKRDVLITPGGPRSDLYI